MLMDTNQLKILSKDPDGLLTYEYLANHIGECVPEDIDMLIDNMQKVDLNGQFCASAARYLHAIDPEGYEPAIRRLVELAIDKDRLHVYLPELTCAIYGEDYADKAEKLCAADNNFRRIYKRLCPSSVI